ncbi:hypothetical protein M0804_012416 [Polistes exclamans]|nr:hypothetical protein M0804_012416 [Polistes exclamans]
MSKVYVKGLAQSVDRNAEPVCPNEKKRGIRDRVPNQNEKKGLKNKNEDELFSECDRRFDDKPWGYMVNGIPTNQRGWVASSRRDEVNDAFG